MLEVSNASILGVIDTNETKREKIWLQIKNTSNIVHVVGDIYKVYRRTCKNIWHCMTNISRVIDIRKKE